MTASPFDVAKLRQNITQAQLGIAYFSQLPSTNTYALSHPPQTPWQLIVADQQTAGRGRLGRHWYSPPGENLYCSFSWRQTLSLEQQQRIAALSLVMALGVIDVLRSCAPDICWQVKWPNDIWGNGQKLAGILLESQRLNGQWHLVVGLGLNVHATSWPFEPRPTSLQLLKPQAWSREILLASVLNQWLSDIPVFFQAGLAPFQRRWQAADALLGRHLRLVRDHQSIEGLMCGIDHQGCLRLQHSDHKVYSHAVGEIQLLRLD